ncbi:unnamed protein product [Echinostoma caproni]|uniref:Secreted protein n=1 Tax=Echinostoma caproni TaxID=27848 RepID=A0A183BFB7_9TREM|nr:unnamed protein product [Echinostoma caproni]
MSMGPLAAASNCRRCPVLSRRPRLHAANRGSSSSQGCCTKSPTRGTRSCRGKNVGGFPPKFLVGTHAARHTSILRVLHFV